MTELFSNNLFEDTFGFDIERKFSFKVDFNFWLPCSYFCCSVICMRLVCKLHDIFLACSETKVMFALDSMAWKFQFQLFHIFLTLLI